MAKFGLKFTIGVIGAILVALASWAFYGLLYKLTVDLLMLIGVTNEYLQYLVLIVVIIIALFALGFGAKRTLKKLLRL